MNQALAFPIVHNSGGPANVLTLSCKNRLTCLPRKAARRLPRPTRSGRSGLQPAGRARAVRRARGGAAPGQQTGGFCQLVRAVRPHTCCLPSLFDVAMICQNPVSATDYSVTPCSLTTESLVRVRGTRTVKARRLTFEEHATSDLGVAQCDITGGRMKQKKQKPMIADGDIVFEHLILDREYLILMVPLREGSEEPDEFFTEAENEISH